MNNKALDEKFNLKLKCFYIKENILPVLIVTFNFLEKIFYLQYFNQ